MFKCDKCGKISLPKEKCNRVIVEFRSKTYEDPETGVRTYGKEPVREEKRCNECMNKEGVKDGN